MTPSATYRDIWRAIRERKQITCTFEGKYREACPIILGYASDGRERVALRVFTTRPDTSFGMTYAVVAPEHPMVDQLTTPEHQLEVDALRARAAWLEVRPGLACARFRSLLFRQ